MKVVLVRPPFYTLFGMAIPKMKTYPLNLLYLATYMRARGGYEAGLSWMEGMFCTWAGGARWPGTRS